MPKHKSQYRRNLPHIVPIEGMFHVVFRVKDSIPNHIVEKFKSDYNDQKLNISANSKEEYIQILNQLNDEYFEKFENELHKSTMKPLANLILKTMKGFSAWEINKREGTKGTFWQDESYDHMIRSRNEMANTVDYILHNPVKSYLCNHYTEHDFTWCADFLVEE